MTKEKVEYLIPSGKCYVINKKGELVPLPWSAFKKLLAEQEEEESSEHPD